MKQEFTQVEANSLLNRSEALLLRVIEAEMNPGAFRLSPKDYLKAAAEDAAIAGSYLGIPVPAALEVLTKLEEAL